MVTRTQLDTSKAIQRQTGRTFHVATRFLPDRVRHPTYVLYAFFRQADEVVDDTDPPAPAAQRQQLETIRRAVLGETTTDDPVLSAVADIRDQYAIPRREIEAFITAMQSDIDHDGYPDHTALDRYLRGSSVAVANMMLSVMSPADLAATEPHAAALAQAFQLTNFLRDVDEDITDYDRVYLPESTLAEHGVTKSQLRRGEATPGFRRVIRTELDRTETRYREGVAGIRYLPRDCQFPVLLAAVLYAEHHRRIRGLQYNVLDRRPALRTIDYPRVLARTWWYWNRCEDPETAFYAASAIDPEPDSVEAPPRLWGVPDSVGRLRNSVRRRLPVEFGE